MKDYVDSFLSYAIGILLLLYSGVIQYSSEIMTVGGLVLMLARLYVDGGKAIQTWRERNGRSKRK